MPTARLGEEMPGSNALHTNLHALVRFTTEPSTHRSDRARPEPQQHPELPS
jgi:hypothetical protein